MIRSAPRRSRVRLLAALIAVAAPAAAVLLSAPAASAASAPVVSDDYYWSPPDQPIVVDGPGILANDKNTDGYDFRVTDRNLTPGTNLKIHHTGGIEYTPVDNPPTWDSFTYCLTEPGSKTCVSNKAVVRLFPGKVPMTVPHRYTTVEGKQLSVSRPGLWAGSHNIGSLGVLKITRQPAHGTLSVNTGRGHGEFSYIPDPGFVGQDSFTYCDYPNATVGCLSYEGTPVTITVAPDLPGSVIPEPAIPVVIGGGALVFGLGLAAVRRRRRAGAAA